MSYFILFFSEENKENVITKLCSNCAKVKHNILVQAVEIEQL